MGRIEIRKLDHDVKGKKFDCGNDSINSMIQESYFPTLMQYCYAYQVSLDGCIIGYYMIKIRNIIFERAPEEFCDFTTSLSNSCSSLHICYLAVDKEYQNRNNGTIILKTIVSQCKYISKYIPITIISLNALKEKYEWYKDRGFKPFNEKDLDLQQDTIEMYVSCIQNQENVDNYCDV